MDIKEAIESTEVGVAYYDLPQSEGEGTFAAIYEDEQYHVHGHINGVLIDVECSEQALDHTLEEFNVDPKSGWYSL